MPLVTKMGMRSIITTYPDEQKTLREKGRTAVPNSTIRVAMGQMLIEGGDHQANLTRAIRLIDKAAKDCDIIVLPECLDLGWTHPAAYQLAQTIPGPATHILASAAIKAQRCVVAGVTEREGNLIYNSAVLIAPDGRILLKHRKINLLDGVETIYATGNWLSVIHTPIGSIGVNICADNFPDSLALGHAMARMGAQIILSPCAWAVPADYDPVAKPYGDLWKGAYGTLAKLYDMPIVGVSNVGQVTEGAWKGYKCIGSSLAVGGDGQVLAQAPYGEAAEDLTIVEIPITPREVRGTAIADMLRAKGYQGP